MPLLPALSFRFKILLLVLAILAGATGTTMLVTQRRVQETYQKLFARQYQTQIEFFNEMQNVRLQRAKDVCLNLSTNESFLAAVQNGDQRAVYFVARSQLREFMPTSRPSGGGRPGMDGRLDASQRRSRPDDPRRPPTESAGSTAARDAGRESGSSRGSYLRVYSQSGEELLETGSGAPSRKLPAGVIRHLQMAAAAAADAQQIGYFAMQVDDDRAENLYEVIITPFFEASSGKLLGSIVLGFTVTDFGERFLERLAKIQSGILINDTLHTTSVPTTVRAPLLEAIGTATGSLLENATSFDIPINGEPHRCFVRALNPGSIFPVAYHLSLYSLADQYQDLRELRLKVGAFALLVFVAGLVLAWLLSHGMAVPLRELVLGTREIEKGNYDYHVRVRSGDEIGQLADSFNTMARGLAQRDKYAVVLRQVADEAIAEKLMSGEAKVGGELRLVTVLFCDIRGFSALTQNLPADEVVRLLNEHMTALTKVVYEHQGVVDKFVGDLIMAVFGAPSSRGNDAERAARCALKMIETRNRLNEAGGQKITIGIGLATGEVLAGCMGSEDRLNYTVLGERVNLASRLCDVAGRMDIILDDATRDALPNTAQAERMAELRLKGFKDPIKAYRLVSLRQHTASGAIGSSD